MILALERLNKFAFVGLTEEWDRSICLFHQKFGGTPFGAEFAADRVRVSTSVQSYLSGDFSKTSPKQFDTRTLASIVSYEQNRTGTIDLVDESIYKRSQIKFWKDILKYGGKSQVPDDVCVDALEKSISLFITKYSNYITSNKAYSSVGPTFYGQHSTEFLTLTHIDEGNASRVTALWAGNLEGRNKNISQARIMDRPSNTIVQDSKSADSFVLRFFGKDLIPRNVTYHSNFPEKGPGLKAGENRTRSIKKSTPRRVAVIMAGEMARGKVRCSKESIDFQKIATMSQCVHIFLPLSRMGWEVNIFLAASDCPEVATWQSDLLRDYAPWIKALRIDSCKTEKSHRCLHYRSIELFKNYSTGSGELKGLRKTRPLKYSVVLMTRPDLKLSRAGGELVTKMVFQGQNNFVWPFLCEIGSMKGCVADLFLTIPGALFGNFYSRGLGKYGCHPSAHGDGKFNEHSGHHGHLCRVVVDREIIPRLSVVNDRGRPYGILISKTIRLHTDSRKYPNSFYEMPLLKASLDIGLI